MKQDIPLTRDLVLIGGGHAHALVLKRWGMNPLPGVRLTLINPGPTAPYTGMLPGHVAGHYTRDELDIDLVRLSRFAGARLILGAATGLDRHAKTIAITDHSDIAYDIASIDIGITSEMPEIPGFAEYGIGAKPLGAFAKKWRTYLESETQTAVVVIGGGVAGVELALAMSHALRDRNRTPEITIVEAERALSGVGTQAQRALRAELADAGVSLVEGQSVAQISKSSLTLSSGQTLDCGFCVGAAGARPYSWLADLGLETQDGFVLTDTALRSSDPAIYAVGDCATMRDHPRPKAGVFAVRAAPVLHHNLRADLAGFARKSHRPQSSYLKLISLGRKTALGERAGFVFRGDWVWRWKDLIDRRFMTRLGQLEPMAPPVLPRVMAMGVTEALQGGQPLCGGCGAKVGSGVLTPALARSTRHHRSDVVPLPGDDAAVLKMGRTRQVITTDHLRSFVPDCHLMAKITANHALGDILAMGAAPQAAVSSIVLPRMSERVQARWLDEIMSGAQDIFAGAGAEIVGGHTTLGDELTIGFTVTGLAASAPITLAGAQPGDALILTRPIGSGVILAGEMTLAARGGWVANAWAEMARPQMKIAHCLSGAHAMTDVTGFGLAGHLMNMAQTSGVGAELWLDDIMYYEGAETLASQGVRSSLFAANSRIRTNMSLPDGPRADLLFDPQTAGGFLATVATPDVAQILNDIREQGGEAAQIGQIVPGAPFITVT